MPRSNRKQMKGSGRNERRAQGKRGRRSTDRAPENRRVEEGAAVTSDVARFLATANTRRVKTPIEAMTEAQGHYILSITSNDVSFGTGPAGTGKTFVATALACDALLAGEVDKIVVTRPVIEAEESMGFLPGEVADKFAPYFVPVREVLEERLGQSFVKYLIENGKIEIAPFAYMRGRTFKRAFIILDEAQNTTPKQMKMFLTRLGEDVTVVINGDSSQQDIRAARNGLDDAHQRFSRAPGFGAVAFEKGDVRRSALVQRIVDNYETHPEL